MNLLSESECTSTIFTVTINKKMIKRMDEIASIENLPKNKIIEKMIMGYVPIPAPIAPGEFVSIYMSDVHKLLKLKPYTIIISVYKNGKIGMPYKMYRGLRDGIISINEFQRKYIERLMLPDAQEEIVRLRKLRESNNIYIASFEKKDEGSMRKMFVDFVNGDLLWK